jgi:hypothetical protein
MLSGVSKYPISQLVSDLIAEHASSEADFITKVLGYQDVAKGAAKLRKWLDNGDGPNSVIKAISWATQRDPELREAIAGTERIKRKEAEDAFRSRCESEAQSFTPFLTAIGEYRVPSPIFAFGMTGGHQKWTVIHVPGKLLNLPLQEQVTALRPLMRRYQEKFNHAVPFFGPLMEFRLVRLVDYLSFTSDGEFVEIVDRPFRLGTTTLRIL